MMSTKPALSIHPVAYVRTVGDEGVEEKRGVIHCTRRGQTVPISTCVHCPRFVKVTAGTSEEELQCLSEPDTVGGCEQAPALALPRATVSVIMTRNVICVRPDLTLDAALAMFVESGLKSAPVVDDGGRLIGFVGEAEILLDVHARSGDGERPRIVGEAMLPYALTVPESTSITRAAAIMAFEGQQRLAIVSASGAVIGVLSASDILYWLARADGHLLPRPRPR